MRHNWKPPGKKKVEAEVKGARPDFPLTNPGVRFCDRPNTPGDPKRYCWRTEKGVWIPLEDMSDFHVRQVMTALVDNGHKYTKWWYVINEELGRRGIGLTDARTVTPKAPAAPGPEAVSADEGGYL